MAMGRTWRQGKGDSMVQGSVRNTGIPPLLKRGLLSYSACSKPPSSQSSLHFSCPFLPVSTPSTSVVPSSQSSLHLSRPFLPVSTPSTSVVPYSQSFQASLHLNRPFLPVSTPSTLVVLYSQSFLCLPSISVVPSSQSSLYFSRPFLPVSPPSTSVFHSSLSTLHLSRRTIACCKGPQNSEAHNQWPFLNPFFTVS